MRLMLLTVAAATLLPTAALAQSMNAELFLQRANKLKAKGPMAVFSGGEIKALMTEGKNATEAARQQRLAAKQAGRQPRYCPPEAKGSLGSDEFMSRLSALPRAERQRIDMTEAMTRILTVKFPCR